MRFFHPFLILDSPETNQEVTILFRRNFTCRLTIPGTIYWKSLSPVRDPRHFPDRPFDKFSHQLISWISFKLGITHKLIFPEELSNASKRIGVNHKTVWSQAEVTHPDMILNIHSYTNLPTPNLSSFEWAFCCPMQCLFRTTFHIVGCFDQGSISLYDRTSLREELALRQCDSEARISVIWILPFITMSPVNQTHSSLKKKWRCWTS